MSQKIKIFDTTLRDGEQVPGSQLDAKNKVKIALQLEALGVDIIEAGFPISSPSDSLSVKKVSSVVKNSIVCALARGIEKDIDAAYEAIRFAVSPRIHTFTPVSDIQMKSVLKKQPDQVIEMIYKSVRLAKKYVDDVEWSGMDASRADISFLIKACQTAIDAGAKTINIPDTVGYSTPEEFGVIIDTLVRQIPDFEKKVTLSVHVHNDLGLATANTMVGILNGAKQIECTMNGIGERAGNCALEEIAMLINVRYKNLYKTNIQTKEIANTSRLVSKLMFAPVPKNKAIVGSNAFAHSSGIHQDGLLKNRISFEIMSPEDVGYDASNIVLSARSGRSALGFHMQRLGYTLSKNELNMIYDKFLIVADSNKTITDSMLRNLLAN